MADMLAAYPYFCVQGTLGTQATTLSLKAAPGALKALRVTKLFATVITSAAQVVDVEDTSGTVHVLRLGASATAHAQYQMTLERGVQLTANEALVVTPGAAGPSVHVVAEGYTIPA
jgi:hypothetical protein